MSLTRVIAALDIGTYTTRAIICEIAPGRIHPRILGVGAAPTTGLHHGYIINRHDAVKSIRRAVALAEQKADIKLRGLYLTLGGIGLESHIVTASVDLSETTRPVSDRDIARCIDLADQALSRRKKNVRVLHGEPLAFSLDGNNIQGQPTGLSGDQLTVKSILVSCQEHHFEDMVQVVMDAGLEVYDVVASPLAGSEASLTTAQKKAGVSIIDIGAETVSIAVFEHMHLLSLEVFPIGSTDITNDIALGLQVSLDEAESIKRGDTERKFSKSKVDTIIQARLSDIFELIENHLKHVRRSKLLPAGLCITGGGSVLSQVESFAKDFLQLPIQTATLSQFQNTGKKLPGTAWLTVYGTCIAVQNDLYQGSYSNKTSWGQIWSSTKENLGKLFSKILP